MMRVFIPFDVPSFKNSKIATKKGLFMSKTCRKYLQKLGVKKFSSSKRTFQNYATRPNLFNIAVRPLRKELKDKPLPHIIGTHFVRGSHRKFDINNMQQIIFDLLTAHQVIPDDNADCLIPVSFQISGRWYSYDKDNPGVWIQL